MSRAYEARTLENFYRFLEAGSSIAASGRSTGASTIAPRWPTLKIEYEQHSSPSIYVRYDLTSDPAAIHPALAGKRVATIIWTTTPWTLPASLAVAFHPDFDYVALQQEGQVYIVAQALAASVREGCNLEAAVPIATFKGSQMERVTFQHPFLDRSILGVSPTTSPPIREPGLSTPRRPTALTTSTPVRVMASTRLVTSTTPDASAMACPSTKARPSSRPISPSSISSPRAARSSDARTCTTATRTAGAATALLSSAPRSSGSSRSDTPMQNPIARRPPFASAPRRNQKHVKWDPAWGEERIANMIATRPDWCISRQRVWGVAHRWSSSAKSCHQPLNDCVLTVASSSCSRRRAWKPGTPRPQIPCFPMARTAPAAAVLNFAARPTSSTCGSTRAPAGTPCSNRNPASRRLRIFYFEGGDQIPRLVPHLSAHSVGVGEKHETPYRMVGHRRLDAR